jgi:hypothetical protein
MSEFEVQSGKHMLALSSSQFDPERTSSDRRQELVYRQDMFLTVRIPTF